MSTSTLIRIGGFAAILARALSVFSNLGTAFGLVSATVDGYRSLATLLINLWATGLYAAQANRVGALGLAGYALGLLSLAGNIGLRFVYLFVAPILISQYPEAAAAAAAGPLACATGVTFLGYALGFVAFGLATWRAGVFPRWAGALVAVGALLSYVLVMLPFNVGGLLVNLGMLWMGLTIVTTKAAPQTKARLQPA
jgi:hypothetical protein